MLIPYFRIPLSSEQQPFTIEEIIIGPTPPEQSIQSVKGLLIRHRLEKAQVRNSDAPQKLVIRVGIIIEPLVGLLLRGPTERDRKDAHVPGGGRRRFHTWIGLVIIKLVRGAQFVGGTNLPGEI